jgi:hypothetical protein
MTALWIHRSMIGNPRYGFLGVAVLPYFLLFELASAIVELAALAAFAVGIPLGAVAPGVGGLFAAAAIGYAILLSIVALAVEEFSFHRYPAWRDIALALYAAAAENIGFRQLHAWWRVKGMAGTLRRQQAPWGRPPNARRPPA